MTASVIVTRSRVRPRWSCSPTDDRGALHFHHHRFTAYQTGRRPLNIVFTVIGHASVGLANLQSCGGTGEPLQSLIHGVAVLFACVATLFWRVTETPRRRRTGLGRQLVEPHRPPPPHLGPAHELARRNWIRLPS
jgi:hypothetical protein